MQSHKIPNRFNAIISNTSHGWTIHYLLNTYRRSCPANLIHIYERATQDYVISPRFFLSNTTSMVNKLDEICAVVTSNGSDIAVITESWLLSNISNDLINTPGFVAVRRDRPDDQRGSGLSTFINDKLDFTELSDLPDPGFETQWFLLKTKRLPRGLN